MNGLKFSFDEIRREVDGFFSMAKDYLDPSAESCLRAFSDRLGAIRSLAPLENSPPELLTSQPQVDVVENLAIVPE